MEPLPRAGAWQPRAGPYLETSSCWPGVSTFPGVGGCSVTALCMRLRGLLWGSHPGGQEMTLQWLGWQDPVVTGPARSGPEGTWAGHLTWVSSRETRLAACPPHVCPWTRQRLDGPWEGPRKIPGPQASHSSIPLPSYPTPSPTMSTCLLQGYPPGWGVEQTPGGESQGPCAQHCCHPHTAHPPVPYRDEGSVHSGPWRTEAAPCPWSWHRDQTDVC